jgi:hypothetical protein
MPSWGKVWKLRVFGNNAHVLDNSNEHFQIVFRLCGSPGALCTKIVSYNSKHPQRTRARLRFPQKTDKKVRDRFVAASPN